MARRYVDFSAADVRDALNYDPETGVFRWAKSRGRMPAGTVAGSPHGKGYIAIGFCGHILLAHRLAWLYVTGEWPRGEIDHRDMDKTNNAFHNLRDATSSQNKANKGVSDDSLSGIKGVTWHKPRAKWRARIQVGRQQKHLGLFDSIEAASAAYQAAAKLNFGEFAR